MTFIESPLFVIAAILITVVGFVLWAAIGSYKNRHGG
jgi:hypothetical protein